jgi:hypothetical protein
MKLKTSPSGAPDSDRKRVANGKSALLFNST